ncbi:MAG: hypothetical protein HQM11_18220 [SAR324 cluster bacterium]|nr:hypothetical protein [SAR324 cluster bacterium]
MLDLILDILPFVVFVIGKRWKGLKEGILASLCFASLALIYHGITNGLGPVFIFVLVSLGLFLLMGWISYSKQNEVIFKLQPAIAGGVFGVILLIAFYAFDYSVLLELMKDMGQYMPPEYQGTLDNPQMKSVLYFLSRNLGMGLLILSGFITLAAYKLSDWWWLTFRFVGFYVVFFIAMIYAYQTP